MDYNIIVNLLTDILRQALPIGIVFALADRLVDWFFSLAFPKTLKRY